MQVTIIQGQKKGEPFGLPFLLDLGCSLEVHSEVQHDVGPIAANTIAASSGVIALAATCRFLNFAPPRYPRFLGLWQPAPVFRLEASYHNTDPPMLIRFGRKYHKSHSRKRIRFREN